MAAGAGYLDLHDARGELAQLFRDLYALGKPTIARVRGLRPRRGLRLALACDLLVAADDAVFGVPEVDVGLWPHLITVPLIRSMPPKQALELMLTGRRSTPPRPAASGSSTGWCRSTSSTRPSPPWPPRSPPSRRPFSSWAATRSTRCGTRTSTLAQAAAPAAHGHGLDRGRRRGHRRLRAEAPPVWKGR
jgi:hypothetical protein